MKGVLSTQICSAPVCCRKCGEIFDLSYDKEYLGDENILEVLKEKLSKSASFFCWRCR